MSIDILFFSLIDLRHVSSSLISLIVLIRIRKWTFSLSIDEEILHASLFVFYRKQIRIRF